MSFVAYIKTCPPVTIRRAISFGTRATTATFPTQRRGDSFELGIDRRLGG